MTAKEQNKLAGTFLLIHAGIQTALMLFIGLIYGGVGAAMFLGARKQEDQFVGLIVVGVMLFVALISLVFVVPQFVGGWKMLKERPNARTWGIIGSVVSCLSWNRGRRFGSFVPIRRGGQTVLFGRCRLPGFAFAIASSAEQLAIERKQCQFTGDQLQI
jgi:hypothetical protein